MRLVWGVVYIVGELLFFVLLGVNNVFNLVGDGCDMLYLRKVFVSVVVDCFFVLGWFREFVDWVVR